ncbi:LamB/YcsF family protein [Nesterenkonia flava]|uniref:5-oxoprolinase subunit A n=1 Tax=Nesterenkonia flava TaxID=469799 RepID=A0ABU1FVQ0_9MICC|nr:5-oxoprolinase subunit PxpA [Nesterenkonia flava]MDR5712226.1 5-oxoprolinase subunit PxpA [Nesterenkonia flava]
MPAIDLNSDVGESFGTWRLGDGEMLDIVSSVNIACGFHAGDPLTIRSTVVGAAARGLSVGAHIGYRDLAGFGRRFIDYAPDELAAEVVYQVGALEGLARLAGTSVRYVKPHGALYHAMAADRTQAKVVVDALAEYNPALPLLLLPGGVAFDYAREQGLRAVGEAFADRSYNPDGTLVSRREPGAVLHESSEVVDNMLRLAQEGVIIARDGSRLEMEAESICTHGDTPGAVAMARAVRGALESAGVQIRSFA